MIAVLAIGLPGWPGDAEPAAAAAAFPSGTPPASLASAPEAPLHNSLANAVLTRPLLTPGRRRVASAVGAIRQPTSLPRVAGIVVHGSTRSVILVPAAGGGLIVAREGSEVAGLTKQSTQAVQATVQGPDGLRVLRPSFNLKKMPPAPALPLLERQAFPAELAVPESVR